jgi:hypothetical protein
MEDDYRWLAALAREFVRNLGVKSGAEWDDYRKSDRRPFDIPKRGIRA